MAGSKHLTQYRHCTGIYNFALFVWLPPERGEFGAIPPVTACCLQLRNQEILMGRKNYPGIVCMMDEFNSLISLAIFFWIQFGLHFHLRAEIGGTGQPLRCRWAISRGRRAEHRLLPAQLSGRRPLVLALQEEQPHEWGLVTCLMCPRHSVPLLMKWQKKLSFPHSTLIKYSSIRNCSNNLWMPNCSRRHSW